MGLVPQHLDLERFIKWRKANKRFGKTLGNVLFIGIFGDDDRQRMHGKVGHWRHGGDKDDEEYDEVPRDPCIGDTLGFGVRVYHEDLLLKTVMGKDISSQTIQQEKGKSLSQKSNKTRYIFILWIDFAVAN